MNNNVSTLVHNATNVIPSLIQHTKTERDRIAGRGEGIYRTPLYFVSTFFYKSKTILKFKPIFKIGNFLTDDSLKKIYR